VLPYTRLCIIIMFNTLLTLLVDIVAHSKGTLLKFWCQQKCHVRRNTYVEYQNLAKLWLTLKLLKRSTSCDDSVVHLSPHERNMVNLSATRTITTSELRL
jgi:hypothetical protein